MLNDLSFQEKKNRNWLLEKTLKIFFKWSAWRSSFSWHFWFITTSHIVLGSCIAVVGAVRWGWEVLDFIPDYQLNFIPLSHISRQLVTNVKQDNTHLPFHHTGTLCLRSPDKKNTWRIFEMVSETVFLLPACHCCVGVLSVLLALWCKRLFALSEQKVAG